MLLPRRLSVPKTQVSPANPQTRVAENLDRIRAIDAAACGFNRDAFDRGRDGNEMSTTARWRSSGGRSGGLDHQFRLLDRNVPLAAVL
jgi:hypothetical protein